MDINELKDIMNHFTEPLLRISYGYVKDLHTAEDIVQEVFIKFYHQPHQYEERGQLKAYLAKMTVNKSKDYLRSWTYRKIQLQNKWRTPSLSRNVDELVRKDEQSLVGNAILELPLKQREVLIHFYFNDMTISEIAKVLSIPESTVKTRLTRGRELLRHRLNGIEWEVLLHE